MFKLYDGKAYAVQEEEMNRTELLNFFLGENCINKECKLIVYGREGIEGILCYEDVLYHRELLRKTFLHSDNVFLEADRFVLQRRGCSMVEAGQCFAVLDDEGNLQYILEYADNRRGCVSWAPFPEYLSYTYEADEADGEVFARAEIFVFEVFNEYTYGLARMIPQFSEDAEIIFLDKKADYFFKEDDTHVQIMSEQNMRFYIYPRLAKRIMYVSERENIGDRMSLCTGSYGYLSLFHKVFWVTMGINKRLKDAKYLFMDEFNTPGGVASVLPYLEAASQFAKCKKLKLVIGKWKVPLISMEFAAKYLDLDFVLDENFSKHEEAILWKSEQGRFHFPTGEVYDPFCNGCVNWKKWFKKSFLESVEEDCRKKYLIQGKRILGIIVRGSDYTIAKGHAKQASIEELIQRAGAMVRNDGYEFIFLSTEDADIYERFQSVFGDILLSVNQKRVRAADFNKEKPTVPYVVPKEETEKLMVDYFTSIYCISRCTALLASGYCAGVSMAIDMNKGAYEETYVYRLGTL